MQHLFPSADIRNEADPFRALYQPLQMRVDQITCKRVQAGRRNCGTMPFQKGAGEHGQLRKKVDRDDKIHWSGVQNGWYALWQNAAVPAPRHGKDRFCHACDIDRNKLDIWPRAGGAPGRARVEDVQQDHLVKRITKKVDGHIGQSTRARDNDSAVFRAKMNAFFDGLPCRLKMITPGRFQLTRAPRHPSGLLHVAHRREVQRIGVSGEVDQIEQHHPLVFDMIRRMHKGADATAQ